MDAEEFFCFDAAGSDSFGMAAGLTFTEWLGVEFAIPAATSSRRSAVSDAPCNPCQSPDHECDMQTHSRPFAHPPRLALRREPKGLQALPRQTSDHTLADLSDEALDNPSSDSQLDCNAPSRFP